MIEKTKWLTFFVLLGVSRLTSASGVPKFSNRVEEGISNILPDFSVVETSGQVQLTYVMDTVTEVTFNYSVHCSSPNTRYKLLASAVGDDLVLTIDGPRTTGIYCNSKSDFNENVTHVTTTVTHTEYISEIYTLTGSLLLRLRTQLLGVASIEFTLSEDIEIGNFGIESKSLDEELRKTRSFDVFVVRGSLALDVVFEAVVYLVEILEIMGFGIKLDLGDLKKAFRRPTAVAIGFCCQYMLMPLIAYIIARFVIRGDNLISLGIFLAGCCPGGGGSNVYAYLLGGDFSLSVAMTTVSTTAALGVLPLYTYTLGQYFLEGHDVEVPFISVLISLSVITLPLAFGVLLQYKFPRAATAFMKFLTPFFIICALLLIGVGLYVNFYLFFLFKPKVILAACLLPYIGFITGGLVAWLLKQSWEKVKTISIETGIQNTSIAYILLAESFQAPLGDLAGVAPIASSILTPVPTFIASIIYLTYKWCRRKYWPISQKMDDEDQQEDSESDQTVCQAKRFYHNGILVLDKYNSTNNQNLNHSCEKDIVPHRNSEISNQGNEIWHRNMYIEQSIKQTSV